ncbi:MAG: hypothetical protein WBL85_09280 [Sedimentisphaerales bacterium]
MVLPSWQIFFMAIVSPLVDGPIIARTFSSSISCLASETAFSEIRPASADNISTMLFKEKPSPKEPVWQY